MPALFLPHTNLFSDHRATHSQSFFLTFPSDFFLHFFISNFYPLSN